MMFRPNLLKLFVLSYGISITRKLFSELNKLSPSCQQLYVDMISYERTSINYTEKCALTWDMGMLRLWVNLLNLSTLMLTNIQQKNNIYKSSLEYLGPDLFSTLKI
ncbi:Uncharacterized protein FWK35_00024038 [Aphis craccivora]|uniref:Uncharacterized protein n=1 Tax=Aphis craccivora TaxID=307492 RepID=A0A6G0W0G5_APHCR|nr:Uncharacterized protein FWK35_00024038 [Aphis craccivora]